MRILLFILFFAPITAHLQTSVYPDLMGDELLEEVVFEYKPYMVLSYDAARDVMYSTIYKENDSVRCVYTGHMLELPLGVDPSTHLYSGGFNYGINCEHTFPRSKGAGTGNAFSDMHHLFPSRTGTNASRSDLPFGEIEDDQTVSWFYLNETFSSIPSISNIDSFSERKPGLFEPMEDHKGNVARAMFYFFTMYQAEALEADPNFFESQRETLCTWHQLDPVDTKEWDRNQMIASYQDDLPNPFILDATLATRSFCQLATSNKNLVEPEILVYPNPVVDYLKVVVPGQNKVLVMDFLGKILVEKNFSDQVEIDFLGMEKGSYFILVNQKVLKIVKV